VNGKRNSLIAAAVLVLGLILGVGWWLGGTGDDPVVPEEGPELTGRVASDSSDASARPEQSPQPGPERVAETPVDSTEFVAAFPFRWLSPPDVLPEGGIPIGLQQQGGEPVEGESCLIVGDVLAVLEELPDGRYRFLPRDDVLFRPQLWMEVSDGEYRLLSTPYEVDGKPAAGAYFLVPVTLRVEVLGVASEVPEIGFGADPDGTEGDGFHLTASAPADVGTSLWLPPSPLRVWSVGGTSSGARPPDRHRFQMTSCSLISGSPREAVASAVARPPVRDEVIHIVLEAYAMLTINLVEQNPGDLSMLLETPQFKLFQENPELKDDGPDDEWFLRARVQGLGAGYRHYDTIAYDRVRTGHLSSGGTVFTTTVMIPPLSEDREVEVDIRGGYNIPIRRDSTTDAEIALMRMGVRSGVPGVTRYIGAGGAVLRAGDTNP
jgi:hypothetical protein